jgi:ribokinase
VQEIVVNYGPSEALCADGASLERIAAERVEAVDTTGAGDAFNAALAVALVQGRTLPDAVAFAVAAGAFAITRHEVIPGLPRPGDLTVYLS